jgi:hypothetical protein
VIASPKKVEEAHMATLDLPMTVRYVTDSEGRRTAVLLDIQAWESIVDWMENATDAQFAVKALKELDAGGGPQSAGWTSWDEVSEDWG